MAQSRQAAAAAPDPAATMTADEQAQLDAMQQDDAAADADQVDAGAHQQQDGGAAPAADGTAADPAAPAQPQRPQTVPHAAFHEERERRKAAEQTIAELKRNQQTLEERTNLLLQRIQPQAQPQGQAPALPTLEENPAAHIVGLLQQQGLRQDELTRWALQQEQARQTQANVGAIQERAMAMEREFVAQTPDYAQAVDHLANQRRLELAEAGYADAAEREVILRNEALQLAQRALQSGRNPAEMLYGVAKVRGWKVPDVPANGQADAVAAANGQQRIDTVRAGQQQARSLGATRGAGPAPLTAQRLIEMSDADFLKMMDTPEGRDLMGA